MSDSLLLDNALGEILVKMLGDEVDWILTYQHRDDEAKTTVISTVPHSTIIQVFATQIALLQAGAMSETTCHQVGGEPT